MQFSKPRARPKADSIVPMINVVFLLLIFFMMTARITQPAPFDVTPPKAQSEQEPQDAATLYVAADGQLGLDGQSGDTVWDALALLHGLRMRGSRPLIWWWPGHENAA